MSKPNLDNSFNVQILAKTYPDNRIPGQYHQTAVRTQNLRPWMRLAERKFLHFINLSKGRVL